MPATLAHSVTHRCFDSHLPRSCSPSPSQTHPYIPYHTCPRIPHTPPLWPSCCPGCYCPWALPSMYAIFPSTLAAGAASRWPSETLGYLASQRLPTRPCTPCAARHNPCPPQTCEPVATRSHGRFRPLPCPMLLGRSTTQALPSTWSLSFPSRLRGILSS